MKQSKKTKQLAIWFLLTVLAFTLAIAWDRSSRNEVSATSSPAVAEKTNPSVHGTKIQDIQLGERVVGKNPQENDGLDESLLREIPHVGYNLLFKKPDGTHSSIELLRPKNWLETEKIILREVSETTSSDEVLKNAIRQKSSDGKDCNIEVYIDLPEMGTVGWATLISIKENIEIKEGPGNVVTGRFRHVANNIIDLQVEGVEKIGCTDNHPIWSVDREDFIEAGKLVEGERVLLYNGETRRVVQKLPRPGPQYVNNLEVFGEHVYHVTLDGVLVHNDCGQSGYSSKKWTKTLFETRTVFQRNDIFEFNKTNINRMRKGQPPLDSGGKRIELHHLLQQEPGSMAEISYELHKKVPHKLIKDGQSFRNNEALEKQYNNFRRRYWRARVKQYLIENNMLDQYRKKRSPKKS